MSVKFEPVKRITFEEANAQITEALHGRTFSYLYRKGQELHVVCEDGRDIALQATVDGHIALKNFGSTVIVPPVNLYGTAGDPKADNKLMSFLKASGLVNFIPGLPR